jgi:uncharacterized protein
MKIFYRDIDEDVNPLETSFSFTDEGESVDVTDFSGELMKAGEDEYYLRGELNAVLHCPCDRCMQPIDVALQQEVSVSIAPEKEASVLGDEYEMTDDDGDIYLTNPEFIDIDDILRQEVFLQLPLKRLCKESCEGLEHKEEEVEVKSPLAALAALKNK